MKKNSLATKSIVPIQHWQGKRGVPVYLVQRPEVPMVHIDILFRAGAAQDGQKYGLAHITNYMLNQGTHQYDADEVADRFSDVGAHFKMNVGKDSGRVGLKCLSKKKYFNLAFKLFLDILRSVNFPQEAFERRKNQILSSLQMQEQTPSYVAQNAFCRTLYGLHPYAHDVHGIQESVALMTREDAKRFYKKYYVSNNATIIMVGDISRGEAEDHADKIVGNLLEGEESPRVPEAPLSKKVGQSHIEFPSEQATVWMGHLGMSYHDPDYYTMRIGNDILGGGSVTSRLFTKIRGEHGLVYGINSSFQFLEATGPFLIHFATNNATVKKALNLIQAILDNYISKGPTLKEFLLTKQRIHNEFPLSLASHNDIIHYLIKIGFYKLPLEYINAYQANIARVSLDDVKMALKKHVQPDKMVKIIVGSSKKH